MKVIDSFKKAGFIQSIVSIANKPVPVIVIILLILLSGYFSTNHSDKSGKTSDTVVNNTTQPSVLPSTIPQTQKSLGLKKTYLMTKLESSKVGVVFDTELKKSISIQNTEFGNLNDVSLYLINSSYNSEDITNINIVGSLYSDGERNNHTVSNIESITLIIDKDIFDWVFKKFIELDNTFLPNTKEEKTINGRNVEVKYIYNKEEVFGPLGYIYVLISQK